MATGKLCTGTWDGEEKKTSWAYGALGRIRSVGRGEPMVFEERRTLVAKWMDGWSSGQRKAVLQDLVLSCSVEQPRFLSSSVSRRLPLQAADFSCLLPRAICLYVFSFMDPRSLCRCARVSWHWRSMVDLDQLWMPECVRRGWCISFSPSPLEQGVWKRHYIQTALELQVGRSDPEPARRSRVQDHGSAGTLPQGRPTLQGRALIKQTASPMSVSRSAPTSERPWRDSDRRPRDTLRYLDNPQPADGAPRT
uniref:F-box protein 16 n=1 Tax=Gasterosteus aculeatus aculeatus TaxID=481459 RepID=G3NLL2_GASAC